jgi:hypothetical protein
MVPDRMSPASPASDHAARSLRGMVILAHAVFALALALVWLPPGTANAQSDFERGNAEIVQGTTFGNQPALFAEDGRVKLIVLALNPTDVTESAAEQIGLILQKNLSNTGHFSVVGPRETNAMFESSRPDLVDCREIACGVETGKLIGAQKVLVGNLQRRGESFFMSVRIIEVINNLTDYEQSIRFSDDNMDESLFRLANSVSDNTLVVGRVLSTSIRGIVVNLGIRDGIKLGDFLVIYKEDLPISNLEGTVVDRQRKNIAIVKILRVNDNTSEALLVHSVEEPQASHFASTYRNPTRQTVLIEDTRRELDTGIRLENKLRPLELAPVALADSARREWQQRVARTEAERDFWYSVGVVGGIASLIVLSNYEETNLVRLEIGAGLIATGYGIFRGLQARDKLSELQTEGRAKGYLTTSLDLNFSPGGMVALAYTIKY